MPEIIKNESELRKYIPNVLATVDGETSFFDKLVPFIDDAEEWLYQTFAPQTLIEKLASIDEEQQNIVKRLVAYQAFLSAIPSLDLVLTPNGFGIVSNSNIAPASKERVEKLMASLERQRDNVLKLYLMYTMLYAGSRWAETEQGSYFTATLFPNIDLCDKCGITEHRWSQYQQLREKLLPIEHKLENEFFSKPQMDTFRKRILSWFYSKPLTLETTVIDAIRSLEVSLLTGFELLPQTALDIVNTMRSNPDVFTFWANSDTAKLFSPDLFINKKSSGGYWF